MQSCTQFLNFMKMNMRCVSSLKRFSFRFIIILLLLTGLTGTLSAQCPAVSFTLPDSACQGSEVAINNTSTGGTVFEWDFCAGDFIQPVYTTTSYDLNNALNIAAGSQALSDSTGDYLFICSRDNSRILRLDFPNGFENDTVSVTNLPIPYNSFYSPNDISFLQEAGTWYALVADYYANFVFRLTFGNGLSLAPTELDTVIASPEVSGPRGIKLFSDRVHGIYAAVANYNTNTLSLHRFGSSILNTPLLADSFTVAGSSGLIDVDVIRDCNEWFAVCANYGNTNLYVINLGSNPDSVLPVVNTFSLGRAFSFSTTVVRDADRFYAFTSNFSSVFVTNLGEHLSAPSFSTNTTIPAGPGDAASTTLIRKNSFWFAFTPKLYSNAVNHFSFANPCHASLFESDSVVPAGLNYGAHGSFLVSLTATDSVGNTAQVLDSILINEQPSPGFDFSPACSGLRIDFQNSTVLTTGTVTSYHWDFGDGDTSSLFEPGHVFADTGNYAVSLTVSSSSGCLSAIDTNLYVAPLPIASFSTDSVCSGSPVTLTDQSISFTGSILEWIWDFGNGDSATGQSPVYSFPVFGDYPILLKTITDAGCSDTATVFVHVNERPEGNFSTSNSCVGLPVQFLDQSVSSSATINGHQWDFGDSTTATTSSPQHQFATPPNDYPIQLIVSSSNGCVDTVQELIHIGNIPNVLFTVASAVVCEKSDVLFTDQSTVTNDTLYRWSWDFGDGTTSAVKNPIHRFDSSGTYDVTLIAYTPTNCPGASYTLTLTVQKSPAVAFSTDTTCLGSSTRFTDATLLPAGAVIQSMFWDFGDTSSTTVFSPQHLYMQAGIYQVIHSVVTDNGCTDADTGLIRVHAPAVTSFSNSLPCNGQAVFFSNTSVTDSFSVLATYDWDFGDPVSGNANSSSLPNPSHLFSGFSGYNVQLITTTNFGCSDTLERSIQLLPTPTAQFTYAPTCYGQLMTFFNPGSPLDSAYLWNFGDNQTNRLQEPSHFYALPGNYTVTLQVTGASRCYTTATRVVTVSPLPVATFSSGDGCIGSNYQFEDRSTIAGGAITGWSWVLPGNDTIGTAATFGHTFADTGTYLVKLTVSSDIGCSATATNNVRIHPLPKASFSFSPQYGNPPLAVGFTNLSSGASSYVWHFGDGSTDSVPDPIHIYQDSGLFSIQQLVSSPFGCIDSTDKYIYVIRPLLDIAVTGDSSYRSGDYFFLVARIANLGTRDIDSVTLEAQVDGGTILREKLIRKIPTGPGGQQTYAFSASVFTGAMNSPLYYCIRAIEPNGERDIDPENNETCNNLSGEPVFIVFPNPTTSEITFDALLPSKDELTAELFDGCGRLVKILYQGEIQKGFNRNRFDLSQLSSDTYNLRITYLDKTYSKNIVKLQ